MKAIVHDTAKIYRDILNASSLSDKTKIYEGILLSPFADAISVLSFSSAKDLNLTEVVGNWGFITPQDLNEIPNSLVLLEQADVWRKSQEVLDYCILQFDGHLVKFNFDTIHYGLFLGNKQQANPLSKGYTGMGGISGTIFAVYSQPNDENLGKLSGLVAHEFHHNMQLAIFPWEHFSVTLAQWMIYEGMAESFATALYGEEMLGYYVSDFDTGQLGATKAIIQDNLQLNGFQDVRSYIYGDALADAFGFEKVGVPAFAGYALGYHIVQAYLHKTGQSVVEATFIPADDIIKISGFFDE